MSRAIFTIVWLTLFSCDTQRITSTPPSLLFKSQEAFISRANSKNPNYTWLDLKATIGIQSDARKLSVNIRIVNKKDSLIWFSVRGPLGIEMFSGQLNPQTIQFIDRINKTYINQPFSAIKEIVNAELSFYKIQEIISASPKILERKYKSKSIEGGVRLISEKAVFFITNEDEIQEVTWVDNGQRLELKLLDRQFPQKFPKKIELKIENQDNFFLSINFSSVKFIKPKKLFFKIPDSYVETE